MVSLRAIIEGPQALASKKPDVARPFSQQSEHPPSLSQSNKKFNAPRCSQAGSSKQAGELATAQTQAGAPAVEAQCEPPRCQEAGSSSTAPVASTIAKAARATATSTGAAVATAIDVTAAVTDGAAACATYATADATASTLQAAAPSTAAAVAVLATRDMLSPVPPTSIHPPSHSRSSSPAPLHNLILAFNKSGLPLARKSMPGNVPCSDQNISTPSSPTANSIMCGRQPSRPQLPPDFAIDARNSTATAESDGSKAQKAAAEGIKIAAPLIVVTTLASRCESPLAEGVTASRLSSSQLAAGPVPGEGGGELYQEVGGTTTPTSCGSSTTNASSFSKYVSDRRSTINGAINFKSSSTGCAPNLPALVGSSYNTRSPSPLGEALKFQRLCPSPSPALSSTGDNNRSLSMDSNDDGHLNEQLIEAASGGQQAGIERQDSSRTSSSIGSSSSSQHSSSSQSKNPPQFRMSGTSDNLAPLVAPQPQGSYYTQYRQPTAQLVLKGVGQQPVTDVDGTTYNSCSTMHTNSQTDGDLLPRPEQMAVPAHRHTTTGLPYSPVGDMKFASQPSKYAGIHMQEGSPTIACNLSDMAETHQLLSPSQTCELSPACDTPTANYHRGRRLTTVSGSSLTVQELQDLHDKHMSLQDPGLLSIGRLSPSPKHQFPKYAALTVNVLTDSHQNASDTETNSSVSFPDPCFGQTNSSNSTPPSASPRLPSLLPPITTSNSPKPCTTPDPLQGRLQSSQPNKQITPTSPCTPSRSSTPTALQPLLSPPSVPTTFHNIQPSTPTSPQPRLNSKFEPTPPSPLAQRSSSPLLHTRTKAAPRQSTSLSCIIPHSPTINRNTSPSPLPTLVSRQPARLSNCNIGDAVNSSSGSVGVTMDSSSRCSSPSLFLSAPVSVQYPQSPSQRGQIGEAPLTPLSPASRTLSPVSPTHRPISSVNMSQSSKIMSPSNGTHTTISPNSPDDCTLLSPLNPNHQTTSALADPIGHPYSNVSSVQAHADMSHQQMQSAEYKTSQQMQSAECNTRNDKHEAGSVAYPAHQHPSELTDECLQLAQPLLLCTNLGEHESSSMGGAKSCACCHEPSGCADNADASSAQRLQPSLSVMSDMPAASGSMSMPEDEMFMVDADYGAKLPNDGTTLAGSMSMPEAGALTVDVDYGAKLSNNDTTFAGVSCVYAVSAVVPSSITTPRTVTQSQDAGPLQSLCSASAVGMLLELSSMDRKPAGQKHADDDFDCGWAVK